ncbi:GH92 family glycosyl hydrolase [Ferruginibacter sp.]|nr:GH92 family glycosyl hydrolase [Ferruginibacter sp.]
MYNKKTAIGNLLINAIVATVIIAMPILSIAQTLTKYVDPFIGTGAHGHTYPGATVPFGMVQLSPDNGTQGWDWCSGYHYTDSMIAGFSHTHLSGTGIGDLCDISVMPANGLINDTISLYREKFSHANEKASPGYYEVALNNGIKAAFTTTERCGLHQYSFPKGAEPVIRFNLGFAINWDSPTETYIEKINDSTIVGYRFSKGWAHTQRLYFAARTSVPFTKLYLAEGKVSVEGNNAKGKLTKGQLLFKNVDGKTIFIKVSLSSVSTAKALFALGEIRGWDFNSVRKSAAAKWEKELEKISIKSTDEESKKIFYSALYHTCVAPVLFSDADGSYQNALGQVKKMANGNRYTVFSLWDTFRALNPLFTVTQPGRFTELINTMLAFYDENGLLPVWDLSACETNCMTGYHAIPVIADAILKNSKGINIEKAFAAMKASAMQNIRGTDLYRQYGYIPQDKYGSSVTVTIEYAYDDWCIAQVAKKLGKEDDYKTFIQRSESWKKLFDPATGFIRAKNSDGSWVNPFDPYLSEHDEHKAMYTEGNAWQHSFFVPHDVKGLALAHGGNNLLIKKLDSLFAVSSELKGENTSPDVSGLIGQYAHGNEPSHHIAYMYTYIGAAWKTQERVRMIIDSMYHARPDGYAGNEDCGQMSAWGVWSMSGLYPGNPSGGQYVFASPQFEEVKFNLAEKKSFIIRAKNAGKGRPYIQSVQLNNQPYAKTYIEHTQMIKGGVLEFAMGATPNKSFGFLPASWPASATQ